MNKYGAQPMVVEGIRFASRKEARRYGELRLLERAGRIRCLQLQPRYPLVVNGHDLGEYRGDFIYEENRMVVVEDVKGVRTPLYRLKKKLVRALYGLTILET
jgi:hypothetical protein